MPLNLSRAILGVEVLVLALPSIFAILAIANVLASPLQESSIGDKIAASLVLFCLIAAWRLVIGFLVGGTIRGIHRLWWWLASAGAILTGIAWFIFLLSNLGIISFSSMPLAITLFLGGYVFLIPFAHLTAERLLRRQ